MNLLAFLVVGLLVGLLARALMPGRQSMGLLSTTLLGVAGSFVGGLISSFLWSGGQIFDLHPGGLVASVLGAILVLSLAAAANRSTGHHA